MFLAKFQKTPILAKILDENSNKMSKNGPGDMKFGENLPKPLSYTAKTKFWEKVIFKGSKVAKNHYSWVPAPVATPHLWPPKRAISRFFPDMTPILKVAPFKILHLVKNSEKSNEGLTTESKTPTSPLLSAFQPPYKTFFHTFRPKGPKVCVKKPHFTQYLDARGARQTQVWLFY